MSDIRPSDMDKQIKTNESYAKNEEKEAVKYTIIYFAVETAQNESQIADIIKRYNARAIRAFRLNSDELEEIISIATEKFNEKLEKRRQYEIKYLELD
ncbi:MAG TPA: hypothetical protein PK507_05100 [bacterium]|jgi:hypothetical protein|nr:hypothetical protein [bacterium]